MDLKSGIKFILLLLLCNACTPDPVVEPLFELKDNAAIGIEFNNNLSYSPEFNVYKYRNFYNGGGVGLGDINNDGLVDVYLVSNQDSNKLFLNQGGFQFKDITNRAGVHGNKSWSTGVTFVDINNDGLLDIYVCNSGDVKGDNKENELFINQGDETFTEQADAYGLNDLGFSTHASFFDYDKDGDLDVYLLNNSYKAIGSFNLRTNERPTRDPLGGDKLMQNQNGTFVDVSEQAGIYGSVIGFGLGVTVSDFTNDGWLDIFVSNDFFERDYLYINQQDGSFVESLEKQMNSISAASMGADAADIDNDGYTDLFVTDMLPSEYERLKTVTTFDDWNRYNYNLSNGYHNQFTRNVLQHNNGNQSFDEVSRLAGVDASDWSWGALFFDMDNDGSKDLFIANGIYKDLTNLDYLQYVANEKVITSIISEDGVNYKELIDVIPSNKVANQAYQNVDHLKFQTFEHSGLEIPSFSNGAAYGDLDNDGDLDLIVNNVNMASFVFENKTDTSMYRSISIELKGVDSNHFAIGSKVIVRTKDEVISVEHLPARGFQSCMDHKLTIGVGNQKTVDVKIIWPSNKQSEMQQVSTNQSHQFFEKDAVDLQDEHMKTEHLIFKNSKRTIPYIKKENTFVDFNHERLLYHMRSNEGAKIGVGDLNGDGVEDLVFPGAKSQLDEIYLASGNQYQKLNLQQNFINVKESEHTLALVFDADGDGDQDVLFGSGGTEHKQNSQYLNDHLFLNNGDATFVLQEEAFPKSVRRISTGTISKGDFDQDGDIDLFVGERLKMKSFGSRGSGYLLENNGLGIFTDRTEEICPDLLDLGMLTGSSFTDVDQDGDLDLFVVGEFMEISMYENEANSFRKRKLTTDLPIQGWWHSIQLVDIDGDGDQDIIAGNLGLNSRFKASEDRPISLYVSDFDRNGSSDAILSYRRADGKDYPYALRHNLIDQIKSLKKTFPDFESFKNADITKIFTTEQLKNVDILNINQLKTVVLMNMGNFSFENLPLPIEAQFSPVYAIEAKDFDRDGDLDILLGGNQFYVKPEMGIYDASDGVYLENQELEFVHQQNVFSVSGEIRDFVSMDSILIALVSRDSLKMFEF